jgi:hypothetical protein
MEEKMEARGSQKPSKKLILGTGGTLGVISLLGACGGACSLAAIPLGSLLTAIGLSGLVAFLPLLRWPLLLVAMILSVMILRSVSRNSRPVHLGGVLFILAGSLAFAGFHAFKASPCEAQAGQQRADIHPSGGELALFFDPGFGGCERTCGFHGRVNENKIVEQPGAKVGDLARCPVSGVIFEVKPDNPQVTLNGKRYFTCCAACAANFEQKRKLLDKS